jgi:hypothetical protein
VDRFTDVPEDLEKGFNVGFGLHGDPPPKKTLFPQIENRVSSDLEPWLILFKKGSVPGFFAHPRIF